MVNVTEKVGSWENEGDRDSVWVVIIVVKYHFTEETFEQRPKGGE